MRLYSAILVATVLAAIALPAGMMLASPIIGASRGGFLPGPAPRGGLAGAAARSGVRAAVTVIGAELVPSRQGPLPASSFGAAAASRAVLMGPPVAGPGPNGTI